MITIRNKPEKDKKTRLYLIMNLRLFLIIELTFIYQKIIRMKKQ
jgi:hypothetical protein